MEAAARPEPSRVVSSACPLDCPDACSLEVTVEDGRVVKVDGEPRQPAHRRASSAPRCADFPSTSTARSGCSTRRGAAGARARAGSSGSPGTRRSTSLAAGSARRATRWGGEAILPLSYGGSNGCLTAGHDRRAALPPPRRLAPGAHGLRRAHRRARRRASTARCRASRSPDYVARAADRPLGRQPVGHRHPPGAGASRRRSGAARGSSSSIRAARRSPTQADLHLALRPGTDLPLALAVDPLAVRERAAPTATFLAEHATGVEELRRRAAPWTLERAAEVVGRRRRRTIERFARLYAETSPAVDPLRLGARAQPQRRLGGGGGARAAGGGRASSACAAAATR